MNNSVVHFELPADDMTRAQAFYRDAFGWQVESMPDMGYAFAVTADMGDDGRPKEPGRINGGMFGREQPLTTPMITIGVDDVDTALATVERLGGKTLRGKMPVGDMGFTGYFTDPEGNAVGLWQNA